MAKHKHPRKKKGTNNCSGDTGPDLELYHLKKIMVKRFQYNETKDNKLLCIWLTKH